MLVSMKEMLEKAKEGKYAVGQFNINNLEWTQAILEASEELNSPVILGVSEGATKYMGGYNTVVKMVEGLIMDMKITIPVAIHLDHGKSVESCKVAIDAGYSSVMFDGSKLPIEENIAKTNEVVSYANEKGVSVEAEVGIVGGDEDGITGGVKYADIKECERIVNETGITCLAPALGSVHGLYQGEPNLGFKEMKEISEITNIPLVLHGGTGIGDKDIKEAIACGTSKINVNTDNQIVWTKAVRELLTQDSDVYDPRKVIKPGKDAIIKKVKEKILLFGSNNQA